MKENKNFVIHIFGYGETQYISDKVNFKTATKDLTKVQSVIDAVWAEKPESVLVDANYHAINLFNYNRVTWVQKDATFDAKDKEEILKPLVDELIAEMVALIPVEEQAV